jgi:hypothetical protein
MLSLNNENINYVMTQILKLSCVSFSYVSIRYVLAKMNNRHPLQLKKIKSWETFWSNRAVPIWPIWPNFEVNGLDWQFCLACSSKTAPRIFIFSIVLGAEYLSSVKSIETHARTFLTPNILSIGTVFVNWLSFAKRSAGDMSRDPTVNC